MTTADTGTAPERVFHTCTYFSLLNLWSEWELAGRNFFRDFKRGDPVLVPRLVGVFCLFSFGAFCCLFCRFFVAFSLGFRWFSFWLFGGFVGLVFEGFETRLDPSCHWMT